MSERRLRDDLQAYYQRKEPSQALMDHLVALEAGSRSNGRSPHRMRFMVAAAAILLLGLGMWIGSMGRSNTTLVADIAEEVAMNHHKRLAAEFATTSYAELRTAMDKLDFSLAESRQLRTLGSRLVGGRYCSIRGQLAAQLRLELPSNDRITVYQTAMSDALADIGTTQVSARGVLVDLWQEDGVFLAMARDR